MRILTHDQLYRTAPAVFASQPDEAVSDRYGFVPTITVVDALQACLLYTSPSPRDRSLSRMPSSA